MAARRPARRGGRTGDGRDARPHGLGSHWRADGRPKTAYPSQRDALSVADERRDDTGVELNAYRCDTCSGWHLGNAAGRER
jgi:hypothetical protein